MSRNRNDTTCEFCAATLRPLEEVRDATTEDLGRYFGQVRGLKVAFGDCPACFAEYLLWFNYPSWDCETYWSDVGRTYAYPIDSSFRSTFDDEPGRADMPKREVDGRRVWISEGEVVHTEKIS